MNGSEASEYARQSQASVLELMPVPLKEYHLIQSLESLVNFDNYLVVYTDDITINAQDSSFICNPEAAEEGSS